VNRRNSCLSFESFHACHVSYPMRYARKWESRNWASLYHPLNLEVLEATDFKMTETLGAPWWMGLCDLI
jgi:hypothetical protein